jgi:hypothetical protein
MNLIFDTSASAWMPETADGFQPFKTATFKKLYNQSQPLTRGGEVLSIGLAPQLWQMTFATDTLAWADANAILTWLETREGGQFLIKAWHPQLRFPQKYRGGFGGLMRGGGGGPFDGTCTITGVAQTLRGLTLAGLPSGFAISMGDMISFPFGAGQLLRRVTAPAVADGFGAVTIPVTPVLPFPMVVTTPATVATFFKPWCLAAVQADSIDGPMDGNTGTIVFSATESY